MSPDVAGSSGRQTKCILVADDDVVLGAMLVQLLKRNGHCCECVGDGGAAWGLVSKDISRFDLIITDHNMPRLNGLELVQRLREAGFLGDVIVHASALSPNKIDAYQQLGVSTFIAKPCETVRILEACRATGRHSRDSLPVTGQVRKARILVAAVPEVREFIERTLAGHELVYAATRFAAQQFLSNEPFELIICTVAFDDADMLDLLRIAKSHAEWQSIPFVCARVRPHILSSPTAIEAMAYASRALGAAAFLNVPAYLVNPEREMRTAIDDLLTAANHDNN